MKNSFDKFKKQKSENIYKACDRKKTLKKDIKMKNLKVKACSRQ